MNVIANGDRVEKAAWKTIQKWQSDMDSNHE